jgi:hypothetical protein
VKQHPAERAARMTPAPRPLRLKNVAMSTSLPPGAAALVDDLVGTFVGNRRAEVLRFIVTSWLVEHAAKIPTIETTR